MRIGIHCAALFAGLALLQARGAVASDIKVLSSPPARAILESLGPQFEQATGHRLNAVYRTAFELKTRIDAGEAFDLAILPREVMDELIKDGHIAAATRTALARIPIGIAVQAGLPKPDISTVAGFKQALLDAESFAYTQGAMSGKHVLQLFRRLGIAEAMQPKTRMASGGMVAVELVSKGEVQMNVDLMPEMIRWPKVEIVGPLPAELQNDIRFEIGLAAKAGQAGAAESLIKLLTGAAAVPVITAHGMVPG